MLLILLLHQFSLYQEETGCSNFLQCGNYRVYNFACVMDYGEGGSEQHMHCVIGINAFQHKVTD